MSDALQIGLPERSNEQLLAIMKRTEVFRQQQDVYKVAVAVALSRDFDVGGLHDKPLDRGETKWAVAGLDPDGRMRDLIRWLRPQCQSSPYRYSQSLAVAGLNCLYRELVERDQSIADTLGLPEGESKSGV